MQTSWLIAVILTLKAEGSSKVLPLVKNNWMQLLRT
jgi:hypothetical protein